MLNWNNIIKLAREGNLHPERRMEKSDEEWMKILTPEQFLITRKKHTESPYSGELCSTFTEGIYLCVCCDSPLFDSTIKYNSGSGWPSFTESINENGIKYIGDRSLNMNRIEVLCNVCDAHLGHVFPDGPSESGLRYCINSESIKLKSK